MMNMFKYKFDYHNITNFILIEVIKIIMEGFETRWND